MAAYTSTQSGNWSAASTWGGSGPPGNGDTATVAVGHDVTVDVSTTVGASGAAGTVAVLVSGTLSVSGGVTFTARGDVQLNNTTLTLAAGATYLFDSSLASGTPTYQIMVSTANGQTSSKLICNGTSGSHCTIAKVAGSGNGSINTYGTSSYAQILATYTDFRDLGGAAGSGLGLAIMGKVPSGGEWTFQYCTFTRIGQINLTGCAADGNCTITHCSVDGELNTSTNSTWWLVTSTPTTGARVITDNNLGVTKQVTLDTKIAGFTFSRNVLRNTYFYNVTGVPAEWDDNLIFDGNQNLTAASAHWGAPGLTANRTYKCAQLNVAEASGITDYNFSFSGTLTYNGYIYECVGPTEDADAFHTGSPSAANTIAVQRMLVLPNSRGLMSGAYTAHGNANTTVSITHSTFMAGQKSPSTTGYAAAIFGSGYAGFAGMVSVFRDNLIWCPDLTASLRYSLRAAYTMVADAVTTANCENNAHYQIQSGTVYDASGANGASRLGYDGWWETDQGLGAGDVSLVSSPDFIDSTRNLATWDTAFLGNSPSPAWTTGHAYSVGDMASSSNAGFYGGATINFRCIQAHTSAAADSNYGDPTAGTSGWPLYWELASAYRMRQAVPAGTTYSVGGTAYPATRALYEWVRAGFAPRNTALIGAASDSTTIGAVDGASTAVRFRRTLCSRSGSRGVA